MSTEAKLTEAKLSDFPQHRENPFIPEMLFPKGTKSIAIGRPKDRALVDTVTGQIDDSLFIGIRKEVDKEEFVKIFQSQLQSLFNLSKRALKVLSYFMSITKFNDELLFDADDCKKFTGYSSKESIFNGIAELLKSDIIARGRNPYRYYANPSIFYKGDRLVLITEYKQKKVRSLDDQGQLDLFENARTENKDIS
jgi:hypothetical protein